MYLVKIINLVTVNHLFNDKYGLDGSFSSFE